MHFVGIDWSDQALDYHLRSPEGRVLKEGRVPPTLNGLGNLFAALEAHTAPDQIGIAVETAHGAWVQPLLDRGYSVYPVNPKTAEAFRKALSAAGNKSDRIDAKVLAMFLACFSDLDAQIALDLLEKFPTRNALRALTPRRLSAWLKRHGYSHPDRIDEITAVLEAPVLPVADHLQAAKAPLIRYLVKALSSLKTEIAEREKQITRHFEGMPEADWVKSLPGAGANLAPSVLACIGRDAERFPTTADARAFMGTAPVTRSSGRSKAVYFRMGCREFARRTLQLLALCSLDSCPWARAFYEKQRNTGHKHHAALRALAHKWLKIILAMKRTGAHYNEAIFTHSRTRYLLNAPAKIAVS